MNSRVPTASRPAVRVEKDEMEMNVEMKNIDRSMKPTGIPRATTKKKALTAVEFLEVSKRLNREKKKRASKSNSARDVEKLPPLPDDDLDLTIFLSSSKPGAKRPSKHDTKADTKRESEIKLHKYAEKNTFVNDEEPAVPEPMSDAERLKILKRIKKKKTKKGVLKSGNAPPEISSPTRPTVSEPVKNAIMKNFETKSTSTTALKSLLTTEISKTVQARRKLNKAARKKKARVAEKLKKAEEKKTQKDTELLKTPLNPSTPVSKKNSRTALKKSSRRMKLKKNKSRNAPPAKKNKPTFKKTTLFDQVMRNET